STLFPYTTLFRSRGDDRDIEGNRAGDAGADIDVGGQYLGQTGPDQYVVESKPFARASVVFSGHCQLRRTRKGQQDRMPKAYKMPVRGGPSPDVTARFWVGVGRQHDKAPIPRPIL